MIINHNMASLNTYNKLSANNAQTSKALEKLSSGLRINRAGDDAAGLAISEKMRGQIRGLDQASRNAQDANSMLNTAEGNLSETQNILQRMKELATQAANDTNVGVDRGEIQKEINQLTSEINRIGNTTEFNTQKLLNGGVGKVSGTTVTAGSQNPTVGNISFETTTQSVKGEKASGVSVIGGTNGTVTVTAGANGSKLNGYTILFDDAAAPSVDVNAKTITVSTTGDASFADLATSINTAIATETSLAGVTVATPTGTGAFAQASYNGKSIALSGGIDEVRGDYSFDINTSLKAGEAITIAGKSFIAVDEKTAADPTKGQFSATSDRNAQAASLRAALQADATIAARFDVVVDKNNVQLKEKANQATGVDLAKPALKADSNNFETAVHEGVTAAVWDTGALTAMVTATSNTFTFNGVTLTLNATDDATAGDQSAISGVTGNSATIAVDSDAGTGSNTNAEQAALIVNALNQIKAVSGSPIAKFTFAVNGTGVQITGDLTDGAKYNDKLMAVSGAGALALTNTTTANQLTTEGESQYSIELSKAFTPGAVFRLDDTNFVAVTGTADATKGQFSTDGTVEDQVASLKMAIDANPTLAAKYTLTRDDNNLEFTTKQTSFTDPLTVSSGVEGSYSFGLTKALSAGEAYKIDGAEIKVVDDAAKYSAEIQAGTAILAGDSLDRQVTNLREAVKLNETLSQKYTASGTGSTLVLTQNEGYESSTAPVVSAGKAGASGKFEATFQIGANTGQSMTIEISDMRANALKVSGQVGGEAITANNGSKASYVQIASVSNGTDNNNVEFALDVSDHTKATAAISVISDAIEAVSAERSKIGAYTNRLEHTVANLSTSSENLTAAESRIRDVDMAKEMMNFQKNNILSQAAQAMLAQANQQPQGVLQLLR